MIFEKLLYAIILSTPLAGFSQGNVSILILHVVSNQSKDGQG